MYDPDNFDIDDDDNILNINKNTNLEKNNDDDNPDEQNSLLNSLSFGTNCETSNKKEDSLKFYQIQKIFLWNQ